MATALTNRYARALVDVVTRPGAAGGPEAVVGELRAFVAALRSSVELRNVLVSPAVAPAKKRAIIDIIGARLELSRSARNFLCVVIDHRRVGLLEEMTTAFEVLLDERRGVVRADVASAQPIEPGQQEGLAGRLGTLTGRQVRLRFTVDTALLGGLVVRVGSTVYDGSVRGRLRALGRRLAAE